ncbi:MAG: glutaredoxin family protein [Geobacteraceae bacterium]
MKITVCSTALFVLVGLVSAHAASLSTTQGTSQPRILLADAGLAKAQSARNCPRVELFVTSWCGYCKMLEDLLDKKGIPYTTYDVEKDDAAAKTFHELRGRGVPLVRVGSKVVYGYDPDRVLSYVYGK